MSTRVYPAFSPLLAVAALLGLSVASAATSYGIASWSKSRPVVPAADAGEITSSVDPAPPSSTDKNLVTGLPLPRFVTLKADKVNVRRGPSSEHPVAFVFQRKGLPVEITAEFENWRKIRDSDGSEGWILQSMLSGRRNGFVAQWSDSKGIMLRSEPTPRRAAWKRSCSPVFWHPLKTAMGNGAKFPQVAMTAMWRKTSSGASIPAKWWTERR